MKSINTFALLILLSVVSCGKDGGGGSGSGKADNRQFEVASPGTYYAVLRPVNFHSNGFIPYGAATFTLKDDQLQVNVSMDDDMAVPHRQTLHMGTRCPSLADDRNGDGFVDYNEAQAVVGAALMPLDNDLNSQLSGAEIYQKGPAMTYSRSASLTNINEDMWKADENPADNIMKLPRGTGIGFEGRVVLAHGTSAQQSLPTSLASYAGEAAHISLPVVCGVLTKVE
jgi:hypothetical protein